MKSPASSAVTAGGSALRFTIWHASGNPLIPVNQRSSSVLFFNLEIQAQQHVVMRNGFHVQHVIIKMRQLVEAEPGQDLERDCAFTVQFGLQPPQAGVPRNFNQFRHQYCGNIPPAILRMCQQGDHANVPLPPPRAAGAGLPGR